MGLLQPYYRISRPFIDDVYVRNIESTYLRDVRYVPDRNFLTRKYFLLERKLLRNFDYVAPADSNLNTHSDELSDLFLEACTQIEANAKVRIQVAVVDKGYISGRASQT